MTVTFNRRRTCRHEGAHAAAMICFGYLPPRVDADWPSAGSFGVTEFPFGGDQITKREASILAVVVLCGPIAAGEPDWPPAFEQLDRGARGDLGQLSAAASFLGMDEKQWDQHVAVAVELAATPLFGRLTDLISKALELAEVLTADDLRELLGPDRLAAFGVDNTKEEE